MRIDERLTMMHESTYNIMELRRLDMVVLRNALVDTKARGKGGRVVASFITLLREAIG